MMLMVENNLKTEILYGVFLSFGKVGLTSGYVGMEMWEWDMCIAA
jgi:hypothetical protein